MRNPRKTHGGKGDGARQVDRQKYNDNWDKIFGKKNEEERTKGSQGPKASGNSDTGTRGQS
jgi:hypothetical protein